MPQENSISSSSNTTALPLLSNEQILFLTRPSFIITFFLILLLWLVGAALLFVILNTNVLNLITVVSPAILISIYVAVFIIIGILIFLGWLNTIYLLTTRRVEVRFGIISHGAVSIELGNIQSVNLSVGIFGFILNFGTIRIEPAGLVTPIIFSNIPHAKIRSEQIQTAQNGSA